MHTIMYVTFHSSHAPTSAAARRYVTDALAADTTFLGEGDTAVADWFVIGGRWSGRLQYEEQRWLRLRRDQYRKLGYADDARIVGADLYARYLARDEGKARVPGDANRGPFRDLDGEPVHPGFPGAKWLVIVDYHS